MYINTATSIERLQALEMADIQVHRLVGQELRTIEGNGIPDIQGYD